jgi:hypothetical protein
MARAVPVHKICPPENCVIGALSGIGTIGLGKAGRPADEPLALVRVWFERVVRRVTKVRGTWPRLRASALN